MRLNCCCCCHHNCRALYFVHAARVAELGIGKRSWRACGCTAAAAATRSNTVLLHAAGVAEIGISYEKLAQSVAPGNMIKIADGGLSVQVTEVLDAKRVKGM